MADITISGLSQGIPDKGSAIIPYSDGSTTYKTSPSGIVAASPGALLQVKQTVVSTWQTFLNQQTWTVVPLLSTSITPQFLSSKILVDWSVPVGCSSGGGVYNVSLRLIKTQDGINSQPFMGVSRGPGSGVLASGSTFITNANYTNLIANKYLDSVNSLSQITYGFQIWCETTNFTIGGSWVNNQVYSVNSIPYTLTLMEIAG